MTVDITSRDIGALLCLASTLNPADYDDNEMKAIIYKAKAAVVMLPDGRFRTQHRTVR